MPLAAVKGRPKTRKLIDSKNSRNFTIQRLWKAVGLEALEDVQRAIAAIREQTQAVQS